MQTNYGLFRGVESATLALAGLSVALRLANRISKKTVSIDDGLMVLTYSLAVVITVFVFQLYHFGYGKLEEDIASAWKIPIGKLSMAIFITFPSVYALVRILIVMTYLRLFPAQTNRWFCYSLFVAQAAYALWAGLMVLVQCKPIQGYWLADIDKSCIDPRNQDIAILSLNSTFDLVVYLWPASYLYKLNLPLRTCAGLIALFSIGIVNIALGFARLSLLLVMYRTREWTRYGICGCMCIVLEAHVGIVCACLPYLRFVFESTRATWSDPNRHVRPFPDPEVGKKPIRRTFMDISTLRDDELETTSTGPTR